MSWDFIADIGGTNARFAAARDNKITDQAIYSSKEGVLAGLADYAASRSAPKRAVLAFAGPTTANQGVLTNAGQTITRTDVAKVLSCSDITFVNDFEAAAWALATVTDADVVSLQGPVSVPAGNRIIVGPGTGLGVGCLIKTPTSFDAVPGEGGHIGIQPCSAFETEVFTELHTVWPQVFMDTSSNRIEAEALLSGTGLPYFYKSACSVLGQDIRANDAKSILDAAKTNNDQAANATVLMFKEHLGRSVGDLSLVIAAKGGVFLTGGVANKNPWLFDDAFMAAFHSGGRFTKMRQETPLYLYSNPDFGLIGGCNALKYNK